MYNIVISQARYFFHFLLLLICFSILIYTRENSSWVGEVIVYFLFWSKRVLECSVAYSSRLLHINTFLDYLFYVCSTFTT